MIPQLLLVTAMTAAASDYVMSTSTRVSKSTVKVGEMITVTIRAKNTDSHKHRLPLNTKLVEDGRWIVNGAGIQFSRKKGDLATFRYNLSTTPPVIRWIDPGKEKDLLISWTATAEHLGKGYLLINSPLGFQPIKPIPITVTK